MVPLSRPHPSTLHLHITLLLYSYCSSVEGLRAKTHDASRLGKPYISRSQLLLLYCDCTVLGRWLFSADDPDLDEGFGAKFILYKVYSYTTFIGRYRREHGSQLAVGSQLRGRRAVGMR